MATAHTLTLNQVLHGLEKPRNESLRDEYVAMWDALPSRQREVADEKSGFRLYKKLKSIFKGSEYQVYESTLIKPKIETAPYAPKYLA